MFRNRAFISYSQADKLEARRMQKWLEAFRAPKEMGAARIGRIFRDETDLSGAADLGEALRAEIESSQALIVLCSPNASRSEWVEREIAHFRSTGRGDQIFALILEGSPNSSDPEVECFPAAFLSKNGAEPLAVNQTIDGRDRAYIRLAAGLLDVPFDSLWQRERRRQRGRLALAGAMLAAGVGLLVVASIAGFLALQGFDEVARRNARLAEANSFQIARESGAIFGAEGADHTESLLMALYGLSPDPSVSQRYAPTVWRGFAQARLVSAFVNNRLTLLLPGREGVARSIAFSPDGDRIVTAHWDSVARIWETRSGQSLIVLSGHADPVLTAAFSRDGQRVITGGMDNTARIWNSGTGALLRTLVGHQSSVNCATFSPDGRHVLTASSDRTARIWDSETGGLIHTFVGHSGFVVACQFSPDGRLVATGSSDNTIRIWDASTGQLLRTFSAIRSVVFASNGDLLVGTSDNAVRIWDLQSGRTLRTLQGQATDLLSVAVSPNNRYAAAATWDGRTLAWDLLNDDPAITLTDFDGALYFTPLNFSPDGRFLAASPEAVAARLWSMSELVPYRELASGSKVISAALSEDGNLAVLGTESGAAELWDVAGGRLLRTLRGEEGVISSASFSRDGRLVVTAAGNNARVWEVATARNISVLSGHNNSVRAAAFSPNGRLLVTSAGGFGDADNTARIWDAEAGTLLRTLQHDDGVDAAEFSPDGRLVATGSFDNTARIWDANTGAPIAVLRGHEGYVTSVAFSPDGRLLATGSLDHTARIWDVASGGPLRTLVGHAGTVHSVSFSPNGRYILTGAGDSGRAESDDTARVWDVATGVQLVVLRGHHHYVTSAVFAPDGRTVLTGSVDRTARLWTLPAIFTADAASQHRMACELLRNANAPLAFSLADRLRYPVLEGQPVDPDNPGMLLSPCRVT